MSQQQTLEQKIDMLIEQVKTFIQIMNDALDDADEEDD